MIATVFKTVVRRVTTSRVRSTRTRFRQNELYVTELPRCDSSFLLNWYKISLHVVTTRHRATVPAE